MSLRFVGVVTYSLLCVVTATAKDADAQNNFNDKYMRSYLPPGDEHYTESWVGQNSSWRHYMSQYSGKSADYQKYLSEYGGPQANYDQYVSLYASMAGADVTSGDNYMSKGKSQLDAWNKSMVKTYDLYIPGQYENFAEQATEERTERKGQGVGQGTMGEGHGGGGGQSEGGSSMPWIPKSGGQETPHSQGGGGGGGGSGSGEVGYEPFAKPWVVQYATDEGGHNAFDYEGKEFASGGMEMGGVQDYADYMNQYAGEWVPADSIDQKSSEQQADAKQTSAKSQTDDKSKKATQQTEEKDQKPDKHKKPAEPADDKSRSSKAQQTKERDQKLHTHKKSADDDKSKSSKAVERPKEKDQKADKRKKSAKDDKSSKAVAFLESAVPEAVDTPPHPAQPALPRWSIGKKEIKTSQVPHPAQPVLPQLQSKVAKEAVAEVRHAVKKLQQAAQDTSYAAWTLAKHSSPPKQTEEQKQLAEAMSRLWKVTREPLTDKSLQELENAGRTASSAIARLRDAEMQQLRQSATSTRQKLLKGAKDWSDQVQRDARKQENEQLAQEAKQAGAQLEKSLSDALSDRTQKKAQELLLHAQQRKQLLQGVLGEAVDVAQMVQKDPGSAAPVPKLAPKVEAEEATEELERQSLTTDKLKAVSGPWLLFAITIAGLLYSVAGFLVRRSAAPTRPPSREIALLAIGEP